MDKLLINEAVLARFCTKYGVTFDASADLLTNAQALAAAIAEQVPAAKLATCDNCGGDSSVDDECCPFCGSADFDDGSLAAPAAPASVPVAAPAVKPEPAPAAPVESKPKDKAKKRSEVGEAVPAEPKTKGKSEKKKKAAPEPIVETAAPEPAPAPEPIVETAEPVEVVTELNADDIETGDRSPESRVESIVLASPADDVAQMRAMVASQVDRLAAVRDINGAVQAVDSARKLAVVGYWHLGQAILKCFVDDLWKQIRDEHGNPRYRGFGSFCEAELRLSARYCYTLMEVSTQFGAEDVAQIGVAKLTQIMKVSPTKRAELLNEARDGKPLSEIAQQVQAITHKEGTTGAGAGKRDTSKGSAAAAENAQRKRVERENIVTATLESKRHKVQLVSKVTAGDETPKRAKRLADEPVGVLATLNGMVFKFAITKDANEQLVLLVDCKPEKQSE